MYFRKYLEPSKGLEICSICNLWKQRWRVKVENKPVLAGEEPLPPVSTQPEIFPPPPVGQEPPEENPSRRTPRIPVGIPRA